MLDGKLVLELSNIVKTWGKAPEEKQYSISTDSRNLNAEQIFLGLVGESFDAFDFLEQVLEIGCPLVIVQFSEEREKSIELLSKNYPHIFIVAVSDSLASLQELAEKHTSTWLAKKTKGERRVIGITGSNGKTTHKEMLSYLLNSVHGNKVHCTKGNYNNHIGVPLTLLQIEDHHDYAIVEMGTNHPGEILRLCQISHPTDGILTNIGDAHLEFFNTRDAIFKEKSQLYESVVENSSGEGSFVVNQDDSYLANLAPTKGLSFFGEWKGDYLVQPLKRGFYLSTMDSNWGVENPNIYERFNLKNLAGCLILAMKISPNFKKDLIRAAERFTLPENNRSQWIERSGKCYFLDAYNANPSSMEVSLAAFVERFEDLEQCFFVLGDMNELGDQTAELHKKVASHLESLGAKNVAFIGRYSKHYAEGFSSSSHEYKNKQSFLKDWNSLNQQYNYFFLKGSRTLQLETLIDIT